MNRNTKTIIKLSLTLFIIVSVCVFSLSLVNNITKDAIEKMNTETQTMARREVMPEADPDGFKLLDNKLNSDICNSVYSASKNGEVIGYCFDVSPQGYGGKINMIIGVNKNLEVTGIKVISMSETAGLGAKIQNSDFLSQYVGKGIDVEISKNGKTGDNYVNAISGATISSTAVTNAVKTAISEVPELNKEVTGE